MYVRAYVRACVRVKWRECVCVRVYREFASSFQIFFLRDFAHRHFHPRALLHTHSDYPSAYSAQILVLACSVDKSAFETTKFKSQLSSSYTFYNALKFPKITISVFTKADQDDDCLKLNLFHRARDSSYQKTETESETLFFWSHCAPPLAYT